MAHRTPAMAETEAGAAAPTAALAPPTPAERLKAGLVLVALLSLAGAFWAAVIHFVATA